MHDPMHPAIENIWSQFPPGGPWGDCTLGTAIDNIWPRYPPGQSMQTACMSGTNADSTIEFTWPFFPESLPEHYTHSAGMALEADNVTLNCPPNEPLTADHGTGICAGSEHIYIWQNNPEPMQGIENQYLRPRETLIASSHNGTGMDTHVENVYQHRPDTRSSPNRLDQFSEGYCYRTPVTWSGDSSRDHWSAGPRNSTTNMCIYAAA